MGDLTIKGNKINYSPDEIKGLTLSKVIKADNKGDAMAIFRNRYNLSPNTSLDVDAMKKEGREGSINFKITARFNKGGYVKQYARGGSTRKVNR
jgi:hypothetical protein